MADQKTQDRARWLSESDVASLVSVADAVDAVERGLVAEARGQAAVMDKTYVAVKPGVTFQALGASGPGFGLLGTKTWPQGLPEGHPVLVAFDAETGRLRAIMAAGALSRLRTGALGGAAANVLAKEGPVSIAVIGSGKQADTQVAAVAAVRPVKHLYVYSPTPANREMFAERMASALSIDASAAASGEAAVRDADVVITIAKSNRPVLEGAWLKPGAHVNAVGVTIRGKREVTDDVAQGASVIAVDSLSGARLLSDDLNQALGTDDAAWSRVRALGDVLAEGKGRPRGAALTLYKGVGTGIADVALAAAILDRAEGLNVGQDLAGGGIPALRLR